MRHFVGGIMPAISCMRTKNTSKFCYADQLTIFLKTKSEQNQTLWNLISVKHVKRRCLKDKNEDAQKSEKFHQ